MQRVSKLTSHLVSVPVQATSEDFQPAPKVVQNASGEKRPPMSPEKINELMTIMQEYQEGVNKLYSDGELPGMSLWDLMMATGNEMGVMPKSMVIDVIEEAEATGSPHLAVLERLPGPWKNAKTLAEKAKLVRQAELDLLLGFEQQRHAHWQQEHGENGLSSNFVVPKFQPQGTGEGRSEAHLRAEVIISDPRDADRVARVHVRKQENYFQDVLFDSIISTRDNEYWKEQRKELSEVFLPLSSLAQIMPVSLSRAKVCAERLADLAHASNAKGIVDMNDFLLHEAQAQLQLALLGMPEDLMESTNSDIRATFMGNHEAGLEVGALGKAMKTIMETAKSDGTLALPSDSFAGGSPVKGPLSRAAVQNSTMKMQTNYGNMLLILFAGHDTTGHTMTWMLFELARNPQIQHALQADADRFFEELNGRDPTYADLGNPTLDLMDRCITETLRLWPAVANGTFRELQTPEFVHGAGGEEVQLPRGTSVNINNWSRHRNPELWGADVNEFNPYREFHEEELARVARPMAGISPQSDRFSPFAPAPRNCLGRNFAQMEMRLIMLYLFKKFEFSLAPPYDKLLGTQQGPTPNVTEFRGVNRGTMGPMDLEISTKQQWGTRYQYAMKMHVHLRS